MGDGDGDKQVQSTMSFSIGGGHNHRCRLQLLLFAYGREMMSDLGYLRGPLRPWSGETLSHNTVLIDRKNQNLGFVNGSVQFYADMPGLSIVQVDDRNAYNTAVDKYSKKPFAAKKYQRTIALNTIDIDAPYVIDVFEVEGGSTHDYSLHGSADHDQTGKTSLKLTPMVAKHPLLEEGEKFDLKKPCDHANYGLIVEAAEAVADKNFTVTLKYDDAEMGTRHYFIKNPDLQVILGKSPQLRKLKKVQDINKLLALQMPHLIIRNRGEEGLKTVFVAVHEPFKDKARIKSVDGEVADGVVSLNVTFENGRKDVMLLSLDGRKKIQKSGVELDGIFSLVSGKKKYQVGGKSYTGKLLPKASRKFDGDKSDALVTKTVLPTGKKLDGLYMIVNHGKHFSGDYNKHAYPIDNVEKRGNEYWVHFKEDHGLRINGNTTTEVYAPNREFYGDNTFVIYGVKF